jgi:methylmalonyl-CoA/ethylmalonyl-CoA epimerase
MTFRFGPVMQLGFVVPDIEQAMQHWLGKVGLGPFYQIENVQYAEAYHRGLPANIDMTVALAQWGAVQVELIQQRNEVPSIYTEFPGRKLGGLQHLGVMTRSVAADLGALRAEGIEAVQWGATANGIRFAYVATDAQPGGMIELIEHGPAIDGFFDLVRTSAEGWDGRDPIRRV